MRLLFAEDTPWHTPWMEWVLPMVERIAETHPAQTVFTRFIPPRDELPGTWRRFYRRWAELTLERIDHRLLELVPPLARLVPPAVTIDKRVYSPFSERAIWRLLRQRRVDSLVITGAETDVCVLDAWIRGSRRGKKLRQHKKEGRTKPCQLNLAICSRGDRIPV